jgi:hypothetical protein
MALHAYDVPVASLSLQLDRIEAAAYVTQSMMSTFLALGGMGCHGIQLQTAYDKVSPMESGLPEPDQSLPTVDQTSGHAVSAARLRRMRAKATRKKLWHEAQGHSSGEDHIKVFTNAQTASVKEAHAFTLESSCQTDLEGDVLPMSKAEELSRITAEKTTEVLQIQFEGKVKDLWTEFERELTRQNDRMLNLEKRHSQERVLADALTAELGKKLTLTKDRMLTLEKQLSREKVLADTLTAELGKKDAGHFPCVIADPVVVAGWDKWDPWLFLDSEELAPMSQTCHQWKLLVEANTPLFSITPTAGSDTDG